jgi:hypothetical protein
MQSGGGQSCCIIGLLKRPLKISTESSGMICALPANAPG